MNNPLCLTCGICCNGVLFRDVELQTEDDPARLAALGLPLERRRERTRFPQPCPALGADCRCRVYPDRPRHCRQFECALLLGVQAGTIEPAAAHRTVQATLRLAGKVRALLTALGETTETLPLSRRFQRVQRRLSRNLPDETTAARFADLSLAVHELNRRLQRDFYP